MSAIEDSFAGLLKQKLPTTEVAVAPVPDLSTFMTPRSPPPGIEICSAPGFVALGSLIGAGQRQHIGDDHLVAEAPVEAENAGGVDIVSPATPGDAALPICP